MQKLRIPEMLREQLSKFVDKLEKARQHTNDANREKTITRNLIKQYWESNSLPVGSYIRFGGKEFRYEASETEEIDKDALLHMYDSEEITREQLLSIISVSKTKVANTLGGDIAMDLVSKIVGDKPDVRIESLPVENQDDEYIAVHRKVRTKKPRRIFGSVASKASKEAQNTKSKRMINVRKR